MNDLLTSQYMCLQSTLATFARQLANELQGPVLASTLAECLFYFRDITHLGRRVVLLNPHGSGTLLARCVPFYSGVLVTLDLCCHPRGGGWIHRHGYIGTPVRVAQYGRYTRKGFIPNLVIPLRKYLMSIPNVEAPEMQIALLPPTSILSVILSFLAG